MEWNIEWKEKRGEGSVVWIRVGMTSDGHQ